MEKLKKVVMFITRMHGGERQFFVVHRERGDYVVPTGKVGDIILGETIEQAVEREVMEEIGVEPDKITDLDNSFDVYLPFHKKMSEEHGFLLEIPDVDVKYLENNDGFGWHSLEETKKMLSYDSHKKAFPKIEDYLKSAEGKKNG